ncbi:MAG: cellulase family glycosylhydrolase [Bacteroidales bacterium]
MNSKRILPFLILVILLVSCKQQELVRPLPEVDYTDLSNLYGFNLLENFINEGESKPYLENDFKLIAENGFNFVRLPLDYRCLTMEDDWGTLNEDAMKVLDQAIEFGQKYGIHVCINLHHAPGFCINFRDYYSADSSLWTGTAAQEAFYSLWRQMAARYKGISNNQLSFNLLNEPVRTTREIYVDIAIKAVEAIYDEDPARLVMSDGWNVGSDPIPELVPYKVVQMLRGYYPMNLTHYGAGWTNNTYGPVPEWPSNTNLVHSIYAPSHNHLHVPFLLQHNFEKETPVGIELLEVFDKCRVLVKADNHVLLDKTFDPENDQVVDRSYNQEREMYHAAYLETIEVMVPAGSGSLTIEVAGGDKITYGKVAVWLDGKDHEPVNIIPGNIWGGAPIPVVIKDDNTFVTVNDMNPNWDSIYRADYLEPWIRFRKEHNIGIMVGEWGVYQRAPIDVSLEWMEYMLNTWKEYDLGWAMWNFRGSFGVADSNREGVEYTEMGGISVDMKMMELLKQGAEESFY